MLCRSFIYHVYFRKYRRTKLTPSFWIKLYIGLSFVLLLSVLKPMTCTDFRVLAWRNHEVFRSVWPVSVPAHELGFFFEGEAGCASVLHMLYLRKLSTGRPLPVLQSSWNVMAHGDARGGGWRGNWRMEWVASTLHTTSERGVYSITIADAHTSAASSRLNWRPRWFKWNRAFRRKTKSDFC